MAVVKSPKNNKRKVLWMSKFQTSNKKKTYAIKKTTSHCKVKVNSWMSLGHRRRAELTVRNVVPFLVHK